jgi:hypothetical protein
MYRSPNPEDVTVGTVYRVWLEPGMALTMRVTIADPERNIFTGTDTYTGQVFTACAEDLEAVA